NDLVGGEDLPVSLTEVAARQGGTVRSDHAQRDPAGPGGGVELDGEGHQSERQGAGPDGPSTGRAALPLALRALRLAALALGRSLGALLGAGGLLGPRGLGSGLRHWQPPCRPRPPGYAPGLR